MSNKKSKGTQTPPKAPGAAKEQTTSIPAAEMLATTIPNGASNRNTLDRNHAAECFGTLERMVFQNPNAKEQLGINDETVDGICKLIVTGTMALLVEAMEDGDQFFANRIDAKHRAEIIAFAPMLGIKINTALLPAPSADDTTAIPSNAIDILPEAKKAVEASKAATKVKPELDITKIESEEDMIKALNYIFHNERKVGILSQFSAAATFYTNWLKKQAGDDAVAIKKIEETPIYNTYSRITELIGKSSLNVDGIGKYAYTQTSLTGSPVQAFAVVRNGLKDNSGKVPAEDSEIATIVKVILHWSINQQKAVKLEEIAAREKNLKELKKDKKANANGISDVEHQIEVIKTEIAHLDDVISFVDDPSSDIADKFLDNMAADKKSDEGRMARATRGIILNAYYGKSNEILAKYDEESINKNVQQRIGIIVNLFRSGTQQNIAYKEAFLSDLVEKPAEEPSKLTPTQEKLAQKKAEEAEKN